MFCSNCGNELDNEDLFCPKCGSKIKNENDAIESVSLSNIGIEYAPSYSNDKTRFGALKYLLIALCGLVFIGIIFGVFNKIKNASSNSSEDFTYSSDTKDKKDNKKGNSSNEFEYDLPDSLSNDLFEKVTLEADGKKIELLTKIDCYDVESSFGNYSIGCYIIRNTSDETIDYSGDAITLDENGNEINRQYFNFNAIGPGETAVDAICFNDTKGIAEAKFENGCCCISQYKSINKEIELETAETGNSLVFALKNNSNYYATGYIDVVYFDENNVAMDHVSAFAADSEIPAGGVIGQTAVKHNGERAVLFVNAYGHEDGYEILNSDETITHKEYYYKGESGENEYYSVVKNISSEYINVYANVIGRDESGNLLYSGSSSNGYGSLAPGEEMLLECMNHKSLEFDDFLISFIIKKGYEGSTFGIKDVVVDATDGEGSLNMHCVNNGDKNVKSVSIMSLFFDKNGDVIKTSWSNMLSIGPGESQDLEVSAPEEYDHVENYFKYM